MDRLLPWLWLSLLNLSPRAVSAVLQETGDALEALRAPDKAFHGLRGVTPREAEELENRDLAAAEPFRMIATPSGSARLPRRRHCCWCRGAFRTWRLLRFSQ